MVILAEILPSEPSHPSSILVLIFPDFLPLSALSCPPSLTVLFLIGIIPCLFKFSSTSASKEPCPLLSGLLRPPRHVLNLMLLFLPHLLIVFAHPDVPVLKDLESKSPDKLIEKHRSGPLKEHEAKAAIQIPGCFVLHQRLQNGFKAVWTPAISSLTITPSSQPWLSSSSLQPLHSGSVHPALCTAFWSRKASLYSVSLRLTHTPLSSSICLNFCLFGCLGPYHIFQIQKKTAWTKNAKYNFPYWVPISILNQKSTWDWWT